jgi:hypothetical protein
MRNVQNEPDPADDFDGCIAALVEQAKAEVAGTRLPLFRFSRRFPIRG